MIGQSPKSNQGGASLSINQSINWYIYRALYLKQVATPSTKTVHPIWSQPPAWSSHSCILLDCLRRWTVRPQNNHPQIQWACCKKWKVKWEVQNGMCQCSTSTLEDSSGWTVLDMLESMEMTEDKKQQSQVPDLKYWRASRQYLWAEGQGQYTNNHLEEEGILRGSAQQSCLKGWERAIINQTNIGSLSKATWENF